MVDSKVPVPQALIKVVLTLEKRAFDAELRRKRRLEELVKRFAGCIDYSVTETSREENGYHFTSLGYETANRALGSRSLVTG